MQRQNTRHQQQNKKKNNLLPHFSIGREVERVLSSPGFVIASEVFVFPLFLFCFVLCFVCSEVALPPLFFSICVLFPFDFSSLFVGRIVEGKF